MFTWLINLIMFLNCVHGPFFVIYIQVRENMNINDIYDNSQEVTNFKTKHFYKENVFIFRKNAL